MSKFNYYIQSFEYIKKIYYCVLFSFKRKLDARNTCINWSWSFRIIKTIFYKESKILFFFFLGGGGDVWGEGARVSEFFLTKNPNLK